MKEYKREVGRYIFEGEQDYPPVPENYFGQLNNAILEEYRDRVETAIKTGSSFPEFRSIFYYPDWIIPGMTVQRQSLITGLARSIN